jgi:C1A family cysteine protease
MDDAIKHKLNYRFQPADNRDYKYASAKSSQTKSISKSLNLRNRVKHIYDQGNIGSCVSNAFAQYIMMCTNNKINISRLQHYYIGRSIDGSSSTEDTGLYIRNACKIISKYGATREQNWRYITSNFDVLPPLKVFKWSRYFKKYKYVFVNQEKEDLKSVLYKKKRPIIFGFNVYDSFLTSSVANTGIVPYPDTTKEKYLGGHCVLLIGYNESTKLFTCVNSWGSSWGNRGLFTMPYKYVLDASLAADFCYLDFKY